MNVKQLLLYGFEYLLLSARLFTLSQSIQESLQPAMPGGMNCFITGLQVSDNFSATQIFCKLVIVFCVICELLGDGIVYDL
jgi:hypothetical protein